MNSLVSLPQYSFLHNGKMSIKNHNYIYNHKNCLDGIIKCGNLAWEHFFLRLQSSTTHKHTTQLTDVHISCKGKSAPFCNFPTNCKIYYYRFWLFGHLKYILPTFTISLGTSAPQCCYFLFPF